MDPKIAETFRIEEILSESDLNSVNGSNTESIIAGGSVNDTITLSSLFDSTGTFSNTMFSNTMLGGSTIDTSLLTSNWQAGTVSNSPSPWFTQSPGNHGSKIQLHGENSDIEVNGWSLVSAVKRIEERLGLLQPNPELESEWKELQELGQQYRKLEQHIRDKQATWDRLKAMPPPVIE